MGFIKEFRDFAVKGNVTDMAVGIIIGASFGKIVSSLVADVIMPPLGFLLGRVNFTGLQITLKSAENGAPEVALKYGSFLQNVFDFTIVAFAVFLLVRAMNKFRLSLAPAAAPPSAEVLLLTEIRDSLRNRQ